jgi:hypothetical protein
MTPITEPSTGRYFWREPQRTTLDGADVPRRRFAIKAVEPSPVPSFALVKTTCGRVLHVCRFELEAAE